jgi:hypothetical protein
MPIRQSDSPLLTVVCCGLPAIMYVLAVVIGSSQLKSWYFNQLFRLEPAVRTRLMLRPVTQLPWIGLLVLIVVIGAIIWPSLLGAGWPLAVLGTLFVSVFAVGLYDYVEVYRLTRHLPSAPSSAWVLSNEEKKLEKVGQVLSGLIAALVLSGAAAIAYLVDRLVFRAGRKRNSKP